MKTASMNTLAWKVLPGMILHCFYGYSITRKFALSTICDLLLTTRRLYSMYSASVEDWERILNLAHGWEFLEVKKLVVRELEKKEIDDVEKIALYHKYNIDRQLLLPSYTILCARDAPFTVTEGNTLGMETTLMLVAARERARHNMTPNMNEDEWELLSETSVVEIFREHERESSASEDE
jgi:hypothetical protein